MKYIKETPCIDKLYIFVSALQSELLIPSDIPFMSLLQETSSSITDSSSDKPTSTPPSSQGQVSYRKSG